jgi:hypothetical protein
VSLAKSPFHLGTIPGGSYRVLETLGFEGKYPSEKSGPCFKHASLRLHPMPSRTIQESHSLAFQKSRSRKADARSVEHKSTLRSSEAHFYLGRNWLILFVLNSLLWMPSRYRTSEICPKPHDSVTRPTRSQRLLQRLRKPFTEQDATRRCFRATRQIIPYHF